jgi:hypothetical protein
MEHAPHRVFGALDVRRLACKTKRIAIGVDAHVEPAFQRREILIELPEQADSIFEIA